MLNYYEILKIQPTATHSEIELAFDEFKNEILKFSPGIEVSESELRLHKPDIWDAYQILLNPETRKEHDELIERERIHKLYEGKIKEEEKEELKASKKWKYVGLGGMLLIILIYFLSGQISSGKLPEKPNWRMHYIDNQVKLLLPASVDSSENFLPVYLMGYMKDYEFGVSRLEGFSVSFAHFTLHDNYKLSPKDAAYINSLEMQNLHNRFKKEDSTKINLSIGAYYGQLKRGTYQIDNVIRAYDNYTLLKGSEVVKVIVNYIPGNTDQEKYSQIVFESFVQ